MTETSIRTDTEKSFDLIICTRGRLRQHIQCENPHARLATLLDVLRTHPDCQRLLRRASLDMLIDTLHHADANACVNTVAKYVRDYQIDVYVSTVPRSTHTTSRAPHVMPDTIYSVLTRYSAHPHDVMIEHFMTPEQRTESLRERIALISYPELTTSLPDARDDDDYLCTVLQGLMPGSHIMCLDAYTNHKHSYCSR